MSQPVETLGPPQAAEVAAVLGETLGARWNEEAVRGELGRPGAWAWGVRVAPGGTLLSVALGWRVLDEAEVVAVATVGRSRGRGLASAVLGAGLHRLQTQGVRRVFLEVEADNAPALALYRRLGFTATGQRPDYYGAGRDAVLMTCELPPEGRAVPPTER